MLRKENSYNDDALKPLMYKKEKEIIVSVNSSLGTIYDQQISKILRIDQNVSNKQGNS